MSLSRLEAASEQSKQDLLLTMKAFVISVMNLFTCPGRSLKSSETLCPTPSTCAVKAGGSSLIEEERILQYFSLCQVFALSYDIYLPISIHTTGAPYFSINMGIYLSPF
jgi:hypothetical protein